MTFDETTHCLLSRTRRLRLLGTTRRLTGQMTVKLRMLPLKNTVDPKDAVTRWPYCQRSVRDESNLSDVGSFR